MSFKLSVVAIGFCWSGMAVVVAQDSSVEGDPVAAAAAADEFTPAIRLLPDTVAGLVRIPDMPDACDAAGGTHLGQLLSSPPMQPFLDAQRDRARNFLQSVNNKVGLKARDFEDVASGEVVAAWLPYPNDQRRPYSVVVVADIRGRVKDTEDVVDQADKDLRAGRWKRRDVQSNGQTIRVYDTVPKPGQLRINQIAITYNDDRVIASDRLSIVENLLGAINGDDVSPIGDAADFKDVLKRSADAIRDKAEGDGSVIAVEYFARPFQMGRIVKDSLEIERGNDIDILNLLETQGFDAVKAAGGVVVINGETYDVLHEGFILAPPTATKKGATGSGDRRYAGAAEMMNLPSGPAGDVPGWVESTIGSFNRLRVNIEKAFWSSEPLVNEAVGDDVFRKMVEGIRDDEDGPQLDIERNVLPNLDDEVVIITDNVPPPSAQSERLLVAVRVKDAAVIRESLRKMMESEPDASRIESDDPAMKNVLAYRVQRMDDELSDLDDELFGDFEDDEDVGGGEEPLLDRWSIALVDRGAASDAAYLMFSSREEFLLDTIRRFDAAPSGDPPMQPVVAAMKDLDAGDVSIQRMVRMRVYLRTKYELLRRGELKDSDTVAAKLYRRIAEDLEDSDDEPIDTSTLPPIADIEQHLPDGGTFLRQVEDGYRVGGFFLK